MEDADILSAARAMGLAAAVAAYRDDVLSAARNAQAFRDGMARQIDARAEPWPPMRAPEKR
jgi:hypothetical protein